MVRRGIERGILLLLSFFSICFIIRLFILLCALSHALHAVRRHARSGALRGRVLPCVCTETCSTRAVPDLLVSRSHALSVVGLDLPVHGDILYVVALDLFGCTELCSSWVVF